MRPIGLLALGIALVVAGCTQSPAPPSASGVPGAVTVSVGPRPAPGGDLRVTVANGLSEAIFLQGCSPVSIQIKNMATGEWRYAPPPVQCFWEGFATQVAAGATKVLAVPWTAGGTASERVVLDYSVGCQEGKPLSQAGCRENRTAISAEF